MRVLEKTERRLGEKLLLKGTRCVGPKCATVRRAYPPGPHGKGRGRRRPNISEFSILMREKQKVRFLYGLDDKDIQRYSNEAATKAGLYSANLLQLLESRLDNTVFRLSFAESRRIARQMVNHGQIVVNGKTVTIPSYRVRKGEQVALRERYFSSPMHSELETRIKKIEVPKWLELDRVKKSGVVKALPDQDDAMSTADVTKIKEFYSR